MVDADARWTHKMVTRLLGDAGPLAFYWPCEVEQHTACSWVPGLLHIRVYMYMLPGRSRILKPWKTSAIGVRVRHCDEAGGWEPMKRSLRFNI